MIFYHFTHRNNFDCIFRDKKILQGQYWQDRKKVAGAISLTTELCPEGHGLPDGRPLTKDECHLMRYFTESADGQCFSIDNTEFCIGFDLAGSDLHLKNANQVHSSMELKDLAIAGHFPIKGTNTQANRNLLSEKISTGQVKLMDQTWWYYFADLDLSRRHFDVYHKTSLGTYLKLDRFAVLSYLEDIPCKQIYEAL